MKDHPEQGERAENAGYRKDRIPGRILPIIAISQFAGTSLWFAGNAVLPDRQESWRLPPQALGDITAAVQFGFIAGTLSFAVLTLADRFSPRRLYLASSLLGGLATAASAFLDHNLPLLLLSRFITGFFLAGIYPVGMKIASGWYRKDLGRALGFMIGALVIGTALPHLVRGLGESVPWESVMMAVAAIAALGGILMFIFVPDGPYLATGTAFDPRAIRDIFASPAFRASSIGYFGHMWELYAFWAFLPALLTAYGASRGLHLDIQLWSFFLIAIGALGCAGGGHMTQRSSSEKVAFVQLAISLICCAVSPLMFLAPPPVFLAYLTLWGIAVIGDSPQYSTLNARFAPPHLVGSALTIANSIGFAVSIASVQLLNRMTDDIGIRSAFLLLIPGPLIGLWAMTPLLRKGDPRFPPA